MFISQIPMPKFLPKFLLSPKQRQAREAEIALLLTVVQEAEDPLVLTAVGIAAEMEEGEVTVVNSPTGAIPAGGAVENEKLLRRPPGFP